MDRLVPGLLPAFVSAVVAGAPRGTTATSWWRGSSANQRVGGSPDSQHLWAAGVDLVGDLDSIERGMRAQGLVVVRGPSHVHVQAWPAGAARRLGLPQALGL